MSDTLRVCMYNVGFGDCFLLVLPDKRTVLVDAGFHSQGKGSFKADDLVDQVLEHVERATGQARLDVVIATHRHQDHLYAFNSKRWDQVDVGEVWLPWVEDRSNPKAMRLWKKQDEFAHKLAAAAPAFALDDEERNAVNFMLWNAGIDVPSFEAAENWSNARALDRLHEGFRRRDRARPRFLPESEALPESFQSAALPGVTAHVLAPPRDPALIEELDPDADGETYRALALRAAMARALDGGASVPAPFGEGWQVPDGESGFQLDPTEIERLQDLAQGADAVFAAEKLDGMINSTSLVLILEIGKARLLLAGDAEWGTWKRIVGNEQASQLLRGATFLKVGHHGSHNATSKSLVEGLLPRRIPAMISTQAGTGRYRTNIPLDGLLTALKDREIRFARSDRPQEIPEGFTRGTDGKWIDLELPC